jgi:regulator of extracellular matrix RemA (YlzA/DUF370 family)
MMAFFVISRKLSRNSDDWGQLTDASLYKMQRVMIIAASKPVCHSAIQPFSADFASF